MESLKELNRICQKPHYREVGNWMVRRILRDAALPVTWLLLHTPVTANQVTLVSLFIGLAGNVCLSFPGKGFFLTGVLLLQLWYYLDHVDGQIARYRKTDCLSGRFFDFLTHHLIHGTLLFCLGFHGFLVSGSPLFLVWGFIASMGMMFFNLIADIKYKTYFERLLAMRVVKVSAKQEGEDERGDRRPKSPARLAFSFLHKVCEIHVLMNILTAAALLEVFFRFTERSRIVLFVFFGLVTPAISLLKISYLIKNRKVDEEFARSFQPSDPA